jgi:PPK2 family polyphosphate:nucleotide phosphotransferase
VPDKDLRDQLRPVLDRVRVAPGSKVDLAADFDPGFRPDSLTPDAAEAQLAAGVELLADYQQRLAAQDTHALLVVLQGIDAAGKDGTIRHVMRGVDPQGVVAHSFKVPSTDELAHDYLWRYALRLPRRGEIGIFNRSHYEEVLVVRVHPELLERQKLPPEGKAHHIWSRRYGEINDWERYLTTNGFAVVKLFLNLSKEEQRRRFLARIDQPDKNWKFSAADVHERSYWDDYQHAYSEMLSNTSTDWAPWYVIPADHKKFARLVVTAVLVDVLMELDPQYPSPDRDARRALEQARASLEAEGSR